MVPIKVNVAKRWKRQRLHLSHRRMHQSGEVPTFNAEGCIRLLRKDPERYWDSASKPFHFRSTYKTYSCAVRRLDGYIKGNPYRGHHGNPRQEAPAVFEDLLNEYIGKCVKSESRPATVFEKNCILFLKHISQDGCVDFPPLMQDLPDRHCSYTPIRIIMPLSTSFWSIWQIMDIPKQIFRKLYPAIKDAWFYQQLILLQKSPGLKTRLIQLQIPEKGILQSQVLQRAWVFVRVILIS